MRSLSLGLREEVYKMGLEHLIISEGKKVLKKHNDGGMSKRYRSQFKKSSMTKDVTILG